MMQKSTGLLGLAFALTSIGSISAQQSQPALSSTAQATLLSSSADASHSAIELAKTDPPTADTKTAPPSAAAQPAQAVKGKKGKQEYTGPMTLVTLPPTPMLDEEGNQRQDPDGKLMFNPPVPQQRDKYGHPLFDKDGKPVMQTKDHLGYDENGKKLHATKEKPPKLVSVSISRGTLTVDGMTGKAALNYEIKDLKYVYFYVPGVGTTVVSPSPFPGAIEQKKAFDDKTLTVSVGEHVLQLTSEKRLLGKNAESALRARRPEFRGTGKIPRHGIRPPSAYLPTPGPAPGKTKN